MDLFIAVNGAYDAGDFGRFSGHWLEIVQNVRADKIRVINLMPFSLRLAHIVDLIIKVIVGLFQGKYVLLMTR